MTIDEAIRKEKNIVETEIAFLDNHIMFVNDDGEDVLVEEMYCDDTEVIEEVLQRSKNHMEYHEQLAEWLEELKDLRFFRQEVMESEDGYLATMCERAGYNKAIDDFCTDMIYKIEFEDKWLFNCKSNNADTNVMFSSLKTFCKNRAEQLKGE